MLKQLTLFDVPETAQKTEQERDCLSFNGNIPLYLKNGSIIALNKEKPLKIFGKIIRFNQNDTFIVN